MYADIPILEAAAMCGLSVNPSSYRAEVEVNCPFCGDGKRHLSLNTVKNQFRCNRCNEAGNSVTLYAKIRSVDNRTAYRELTSGAHIFTGVKKDTPQESRQCSVRPLQDRHNVYFDMLQALELSDKHRRNLLSRGFDETRIDRNMYRSMPEAGSWLYTHLMYNLSKTYDLSGIPGFYMRGQNWEMVTRSGLLVPVCDRNGYIQGLQIRLDDASNRKYRWFSSNHFEHGTATVPWIHVANWNGQDTVYVTEGALKAEAASYLMGDACVVGLAGVDCVNGLPELLGKLGVSDVVEAFDMDKTTKPQVKKALNNLYDIVRKQGIKCRPAAWNPAYKGIDDFYLVLRKRQAAAA